MANRKNPGTGLATWRKLYEEAALFRAHAPWQWLANEDLFAVEHPATKEIAFCVVMGAAGMEFGLLAHRGLEGLLIHTMAMDELLDHDEVLLRSNHMSFSLGDREDMEPHDRSIQAALGLKFRGRQAWPLFRRMRPAYLPATLEEDEVAFLTICLEQARQIADEVGAHSELSGVSEGEIPTRRQTATGEWETALTSVSHLAYRPAAHESRLSLLAQHTSIATLTWEARLIALVPVAGERGDDAHWARVLLCVDHVSGFIFGTNVLGPRDTVQDAFMEAMERAEHVPERLLLSSGLLKAELAPVTDALGIDVELVDELPALDEAEAAMKAAFRR